LSLKDENAVIAVETLMNENEVLAFMTKLLSLDRRAI